MENEINNGMWQLQTMFHQSWIGKIKEQTGATHVLHIKDEVRNGEKINCIYIKSKDKEIKYGGKKAFVNFTDKDYKTAINEYNKI